MNTTATLARIPEGKVRMGRSAVRAEALVAGSVVLATAGQVMLKLGLGRSPGPWTSTVRFVPLPLTFGILSGLFIYGMGTLLWMAAVSKRNISYLYPLASLNYILVALCGHFILHEPLLPLRLAGIAIIATGIGLLACMAPEQDAL